MSSLTVIDDRGFKRLISRRYIQKLLLFISIFLLIMSLALYDRSLNPDYLNYYYDYNEEVSRFDFGYAIAIWVAKYVGIEYDLFLFGWIAINTFILLFIYSSSRMLLLLATPNIVYFSQEVLGTQLRYSMAISIAVLTVVIFARNRGYLKLVAGAILALLLHAGIVLMSALMLVLPVSSWMRGRSRSGFILLCVILGSSVAAFVAYGFDYLATYFGKSYYIDSIYMQNKSVVSVIYAVAMTALAAFSVREKKTGRSVIALFAFQIGCLSVAFSGMAVIGGRYLYVLWLFEPFLVYSALQVGGKYRDNKSYLLAAAMSLLSISKLFTQEYHLTHYFSATPFL